VNFNFYCLQICLIIYLIYFNLEKNRIFFNFFLSILIIQKYLFNFFLIILFLVLQNLFLAHFYSAFMANFYLYKIHFIKFNFIVR